MLRCVCGCRAGCFVPELVILRGVGRQVAVGRIVTLEAVSSTLLLVLDLAGIAVFAVAGALAAVDAGFDLFGVVALAVVNAVGGGLIRDGLLGATPAAALQDWRYLGVPCAIGLVALVAHPVASRLGDLIVVVDALGLAIFAVAGTQKALRFGIGAPGAVALGVVTAVGGGVLRDVLVQRAPLVLHRDIYALAAAVGGVIAVGGDRMDLRPSLVAIVAVVATWALRMTAYHLKWNAPFPRSAR